MSAPALEVVCAAYAYADGTRALSDVSFSVEAGGVVGLVGPSGAGKSTLLLAAVGLLSVREGSISVMGLQVTKKNLKQVRDRVGLIFQNPDDQLFMPTLYDDVAFGLLNQGVNGAELDLRVKKAIAERGLSGKEHKFPGHLSGGQKRLASLATVLAMEPEVLLLDEPSSNLDPRARRKLIRQLAALDNTRIIASHDLEMVLELCSRIIVLDQGRIVADGNPRQILSDAALMEAHGLEKPHSLIPHEHYHG
ncbi:MAG TPA: ABC transporter ATP-binding protein [bacterium]|nr:ABC transporter ATP-binding protein [bacterium]